MATDLVTLAEARAHLYIDVDGTAGSPHDVWLAIFIPVVSEMVTNWLKDDWRLYVSEVDSSGDIELDSSGDPIPTSVVRNVVKGAVLVELASLFRFREGEGDNRVEAHEGHGYTLSRTATAMLSSLRKSTVA